MSTKEIKRTVLINSLCLLGFIFYSSFIILDLVQQFYTPIPSMIAELIVCIGIYKLNSSPVYKRKWLARILVITLAYLFYFININFIFTGKLTEFFYLLIMVISMVLFDNFWLQVGVLIVCIASFYIPNHFFHHYDRSPLIVINGTEIDFVGNPKHFEYIEEQIFNQPIRSNTYIHIAP